jgi:hypothetical protein
MTAPSITTSFLARLLADSVTGKPDELAAELVANDGRLARGEARGVAIAAELRRVELEAAKAYKTERDS